MEQSFFNSDPDTEPEYLSPEEQAHIEDTTKQYTGFINSLISGEITPQQAIDRLSRNHHLLEKNSNKDSLVPELLNHGTFLSVLERSLAIVRRLKLEASLLALDIDQFKDINDTLGHLKGDELIKIIAKEMTQHTREADPKGRVGGDEFAILLIGSDVTRAQEVAQRVSKAASDKAKEAFPDYNWQNTRALSIGITQLVEDDTADSFRSRADAALYEAKNNPTGIVISAENTLGQNK